MNSTHIQLPLSAVTFGERMRQDYGDIESLVDSILEKGIIHPPAITQRGEEYILVAGGRRTTAYKAIFAKYPERFPTFTFTLLPGTITDAELRLLELTENVDRKDMTWQERTLNMCEAYELLSKEARKKGVKAIQKFVGKELKVDQGYISHAVILATELRKNNPVVCEATSFQDAYRALLSQRKDELNAAYLARQKAAKGPETPLADSENSEGEGSPDKDSGENESPLDGPICEKEHAPSSVITREELSRIYHHGDCLSVMEGMKNHFNAIITDPPYGIEMSNLKGNNTERVADTHIVADNLTLLEGFIPAAYDCLRDNGFLVMWCDSVHLSRLTNLAEQAGFKVVRWPLVWCKTSSCYNNAPQYNPTKSTEFVFVARKGNATLTKPMTSNFFVAPNERHASHPFFKPAEVWAWLFSYFTQPGDAVLDPFAGEGSSLIASFQAKCVPTAIEIDEKHINNALLTLPALTSKLNAFDDFFS